MAERDPAPQIDGYSPPAQIAGSLLDALSLIMFQHDYLQRLVELDRADALDRLDKVLRFVNGEPVPATGELPRQEATTS